MNNEHSDLRGYVYFCSDGNAIKIGKTKSIAKRIGQLQTRYYIEFSILCYIISEKYSELEKEIHKKLSEFRLKGEWFKISNDKLYEFLKENNYEFLQFNELRKSKKVNIPDEYVLFDEFCEMNTFLSKNVWKRAYIKNTQNFKNCVSEIENVIIVSLEKFNHWIKNEPSLIIHKFSGS